MGVMISIPLWVAIVWSLVNFGLVALALMHRSDVKRLDRRCADLWAYIRAVQEEMESVPHPRRPAKKR